MKEHERNHRGRNKSLCSPKEFPLKTVTEKIIDCAIEVHSTLGPRLLEGIYAEALAHEFKLRRVNFERQKEIFLKYKGKEMGKHRIDYLIEQEGILEIKAIERMNKIFGA